jgi:peptide/nickel transport system substrate-binding protein
MTTGILPKHVWEEVPASSARLAEFNLKPIGSGRWKFSELTKDKTGNIRTYKLSPNERYHEKAPYISELVFKFYPDFVSAVDALNQSQVMSISFLPADLADDVRERARFNYYKLELPQYTAIFFNQKTNERLKNKTIRIALAHAIDKEALVAQALAGTALRIDSPILPNQPEFLSELTLYEHNQEKALALFAEEGWKMGDDGFFAKGNETFSLTLTTVNHPENERVALALKAMWEKVGVRTEVSLLPAGDIQANVIRNRDFEMLLYGEIIGADPDPFPFWHSSQAEHPGLNLAQFKDVTTDSLLEEARETTDEAARIEKYKAFQKIIQREVPAIFLYAPTYTYVQDKRIKNFAVTRLVTPADRFNNLSEWYLKTKKTFAKDSR